MNLNDRKLDIIEEVLNLEDENTISLLENALKSPKKMKKSLADFVGILSTKDAKNMRKVIEEGCETIHTDDWK